MLGLGKAGPAPRAGSVFAPSSFTLAFLRAVSTQGAAPGELRSVLWAPSEASSALPRGSPPGHPAPLVLAGWARRGHSKASRASVGLWKLQLQPVLAQADRHMEAGASIEIRVTLRRHISMYRLAYGKIGFVGRC